METAIAFNEKEVKELKEMCDFVLESANDQQLAREGYSLASLLCFLFNTKGAETPVTRESE